MIIIPAVDIKDGKCVRLLQGRMDAETVFSDDPAAMAAKWEALGAEILHVVDLDGAIAKAPENLAAIRAIVERVKVPIQVGGGIRNMQTIEMYLDMGVERVIIGSTAVHDPDLVISAGARFPGRIIVGIDARNGMVAIEGWTHTTTVKAVDLAQKFQQAGIAAINFTDIHRDGMQTGPNLEETRKLAEALTIPVVASGGVSTIEDILNLLALETSGVTGVITGKALYSGSLDLGEAIRVAKKSS